MRRTEDKTLTAPPDVARSNRTQPANRRAAMLGLAVLLAASFASPLGNAFGDDAPPESNVGVAPKSLDKAADGAKAGGPAATQPARMADDPRLKRLGHTVLWSVVLLLVFISAAIVIIVFSRRYRQYLSQSTRHDKTEYVDVWKLHKVPENLDIEPDEAGDEEDAS